MKNEIIESPVESEPALMQRSVVKMNFRSCRFLRMLILVSTPLHIICSPGLSSFFSHDASLCRKSKRSCNGIPESVGSSGTASEG